MENWPAVRRVFPAVVPWLPYRGLGRQAGLPDLDAIDVGQGALDGLTPVEKRTYVSFWALVGAPMYTGNDLTRLTPEGAALLGHRWIRAINAGPTVASPASGAAAVDGVEVWRAQGPDGDVAVHLYPPTPSDSAQTVLDSLPEAMRNAFVTQDKDALVSALESMTTAQREHHIERCIACGLWKP